MSLPEWRGLDLGGVASPIEEYEERSRTSSARIKNTPFQNIEKKLRMMNRQEFQTPTQDFLRHTPPSSGIESSLASQINKLSNKAIKSDNQHLSTIISQREIISKTDLEMMQCLSEIKSMSNYLTNIDEVINEVESHITSEGKIENKVRILLDVSHSV